MLPIEQAILAAGLDLRRIGTNEFHGFSVAKRMQDIGEAYQLTAHGTLYKALGRMETAGLLESHWEKADLALEEGRPAGGSIGSPARENAPWRPIVPEAGQAVAGPRRGLASS